MKKLFLSVVLCAALPVMHGCLPKAGCTDHTAENYDPEAKEWDGSCIASRDKLIGNFTYTRLWTDVFTEDDSISFGNIQITQSGKANNAFLLNMDGEYVLGGVIAAFDVVMDPYSEEWTYFFMPYTRTFTGQGEWLLSDTVDVALTLTTRRPAIEGNPAAIVLYSQNYNYYLTKQ